MSAEYNSNPIVRTKKGAEEFMRRYRATERAHPCYLGHTDCSTHDGGPCMDETLSNFPDADD